jgi:putative hydrolase of the HAD superfamily
LKKTKASSFSPRLVLLSNTDSLHFEYIREAFPEIFIFDEYVLSYETGSLKPETEIYNNALKQAGISPEEAVFIDDLEENVKAADRLGMKGILYRKGMDLRLELSRYGISVSGQDQG